MNARGVTLFCSLLSPSISSLSFSYLLILSWYSIVIWQYTFIFLTATLILQFFVYSLKHFLLTFGSIPLLYGRIYFYISDSNFKFN